VHRALCNELHQSQDLSATDDRSRPVLDQAAAMSLYAICVSRRSLHEMRLETMSAVFFFAKWNVRIATKAG